MTWVKTDDSAPHHPKLIRAGAEAAWLWHAGLCYSNKNKLNGWIPKDLLSALYIPLASKAKKLAEKLCEVRLWHDRGDHYEIHDYADYQEQALKETQDARREYERDRKRAQRSGTNRHASDSFGPENVPDNVPDAVPSISTPVPSATRADPDPSRPVSVRNPGGRPLEQHRYEPSSSAIQAFALAFGSEAFRRDIKPSPTLSPGQLQRFAKRAGEHANGAGLDFDDAARELVSQAFDDAESSGKPVALTLADCTPGKARGVRTSAADADYARRNPTRDVDAQGGCK